MEFFKTTRYHILDAVCYKMWLDHCEANCPNWVERNPTEITLCNDLFDGSQKNFSPQCVIAVQ